MLLGVVGGTFEIGASKPLEWTIREMHECKALQGNSGPTRRLGGCTLSRTALGEASVRRQV